MTLRDTVTKWHAAMCLLDENKPDQAVLKLLEIEKPSARIFYNLGCIYMLQHRYREAIPYFNTSIDMDKYLAIAFYQRGLCYYEIQRYDTASSDFLSARSMIHNEGIDYKQLGAEVILSPQLTNVKLQVLSVRDCILRPQKALVDSLVKQTFLGNAKVISSARGEDIVNALEKRKPRAVKPRTFASVPSSPTSSRCTLNASSTKRIFVPPPPPNRPPPRLHSAVVGQELRLKSRSLEDMTGSNLVNQSVIVGGEAQAGRLVRPLKAKPAIMLNLNSLIADKLSLFQGDATAHQHTTITGDNGIQTGVSQCQTTNQARENMEVLDSFLQRNSVNNHETKGLSTRPNMSDKQNPLRSVSNQMQECVSLHEREETQLCQGHVSAGHAAHMKLFFERGLQQEESMLQKDIRSTAQSYEPQVEKQRTAFCLQNKSLHDQQQGGCVNSQQERMNTHSLSSSSLPMVPGSEIQKSPKPTRPPPPKFVREFT